MNVTTNETPVDLRNEYVDQVIIDLQGAALNLTEILGHVYDDDKKFVTILLEEARRLVQDMQIAAAEAARELICLDDHLKGRWICDEM